MKGIALEDLQDRLDQTVRNLYQLRVRATTKELDNTAQIRQERRNVARLKQAIAEKQRDAAKAGKTE